MKKEEEKETLHDESTELRKLEGTRGTRAGERGEHEDTTRKRKEAGWRAILLFLLLLLLNWSVKIGS
jgi:hypothetical protein